MARLTNQQLHDELISIKSDVREIKVRLLDPDNGTISRVNKNTSKDFMVNLGSPCRYSR